MVKIPQSRRQERPTDLEGEVQRYKRKTLNQKDYQAYLNSIQDGAVVLIRIGLELMKMWETSVRSVIPAPWQTYPLTPENLWIKLAKLAEFLNMELELD